MKRIIILTLFLILGIHGATNAVPCSVIKADNFIQLINSSTQYARIEGKILNSQITDNSKVIFLNFGKNFNTSLSALIYTSDLPDFIDAGIEQPDKYFENKKVVVEGIVRISNGKPEVIVTSPSQIKIID